jgi:hypothetical protein
MAIITLYYAVKGKALSVVNEAPRHEDTWKSGGDHTFLTSAPDRRQVTCFTSCLFILSGKKPYSSAVPKYSQRTMQQEK